VGVGGSGRSSLEVGPGFMSARAGAALRVLAWRELCFDFSGSPPVSGSSLSVCPSVCSSIAFSCNSAASSPYPSTESVLVDLLDRVIRGSVAGATGLRGAAGSSVTFLCTMALNDLELSRTLVFAQVFGSTSDEAVRVCLTTVT
jgi:hypothetical protein